jgi:phosphoribosylformylglycinamidine cyclo-ligase
VAIRAAVRGAAAGGSSTPPDVHGIAHVTGGGLPGNVPRIVPEGLAARVDPSAWAMPPVMRLLGRLARISDEEVRATFNGGIGMVVAVPPAGAAAAGAASAEHGIAAVVMGEIVPAAGGPGIRYVEVS